MNLSLAIRGLSRTKKITIGLSVLVLAISLTQPAFYIDREDYDAWANSLVLFFFGWSFILGGSFESLIWWANPIYLFALFLFIKNNKLSILVSFLALIISIQFSFFDNIMTSESGSSSKITSLEPGYKLWVFTFSIFFIGTIVDTIVEFRKQKIVT